MNDASTSCLPHALAMARKGWAVFPVNGKRPRTRHGLSEATTDEEQIRRWWSLWPDAGVAIATGATSGIWVLDLDGPEALDQLTAWELEYGEIPETVTAKTRKGSHLYFRMNGHPIRNSAGTVAPGIDVRGTGGYVVAPPSPHPDGGAYAWADKGHPRIVSPADAPPWLEDRVVRVEPEVTEGVAGEGIPEGRRDATLASLAGSMRRRAMSPEAIEAALQEENRLRCRPPLPLDDVRRIAQSVSRYAPAAGCGVEGERPTIEVREELNAVTREALDALAARPDLGVYVRGRMLVTVGRDGSPAERWLQRPPGSPVIVPIEPTRMMALLDDAARWEKFQQRTEAMVPARPPEWVAHQILGRLEWSFPYLDSVVETPTLRPDGSVLTEPGWDEATGLLFEPLPGLQWPEVPNRPSDEDVRQSTALLLDPVRDFPFIADTDRAAYVAAVLSLLARHMIDGPIPLFPIRAPTPGTGKGLLAHVVGMIGTGRVPPAMTMSYEGDELRKRITALAVGGTQCVLLDNLSGSVGSDALAAALTCTEWEDRILGATQMVRVPLRAVWLATGNNLGFKRTLGRRVVPIDLDAKHEAPEDRDVFHYPHLLAHVQEHRPEYVAAGLTLLRAFHLAGRPTHGKPRMGSFEAWDDLVRSAVIWAGLEDPAGTEEGGGRGRIRAQADDDVENLSALLDTLNGIYGMVAFSTADVLSRAKEDPELQAVLDAVATPPRGGHPTAHSLGAKLRDHQGRPVGGLVLRKVGRAWRVEPFKTEAAK